MAKPRLVSNINRGKFKTDGSKSPAQLRDALHAVAGKNGATIVAVKKAGGNMVEFSYQGTLSPKQMALFL